jgi:hypothetical protein
MPEGEILIQGNPHQNLRKGQRKGKKQREESKGRVKEDF